MAHLCPWWFAYTFDNPLRAFFHKPEEIFSGYVAPGMTVADFGCGLGYFSLGLARLVGGQGRVIAVDVQKKMLAGVSRRAGRAGLSGIVETHLCAPGAIGVTGPVDFALAFWMVHETPDVTAFLRQIHKILKPGGLLLITEPKLHVSRAEFTRELGYATAAGFSIADRPEIAFSHAAFLKK